MSETTAMTLKELVTALKAKGFTHVKTFGPVLTLDSWNPYGMSPGGVNYREGDKVYMGEIIESDGQTRVRDYCEHKVDRPFVLGVWEPITLEGP